LYILGFERGFVDVVEPPVGRFTDNGGSVVVAQGVEGDVVGEGAGEGPVPGLLEDGS